MVWWTQPLEVKSAEGDGHSGKWRMTCESDETGVFYADESHEHDSSDECAFCSKCNQFAQKITGIRRIDRSSIEEAERLELARLKQKYEPEN